MYTSFRGRCRDEGRRAASRSPEVDTLELAKQTRQKQGLWEVEVSHGGEADLHQHLIDCTKNPEHLKFTPVHTFGMHHFPAGCDDRDLLDFTQALADLTVRVSVSFISPERPETFPGSSQPYPLWSHRGRKMTVVGTGRVTSLLKFLKDEAGDSGCPCQQCRNSVDKKPQFAYVDIETAAHVVYDRIEGQNTTCHLFFDTGSQPAHCPGAVALRGAINVCSKMEEDWCKLTCATHDPSLISKLEKMVNRWNCLWEQLDTKYNKYVPVTPERPGVPPAMIPRPFSWHKLTIIVSHPHGCSKQVSIGYCVKRDQVDNRYVYTYSTATCPGSSGAPVFVLGLSLWWLSTDYVHSGVSGWNTRYNCSGYGSR